MDQMSFEDATLFITVRSPFARRVRLAFLENQIPFQEQPCDIFHPDEQLLALNPVARVPILKLKSGEILIDSNLILQALYENIDSPLKPKNRSEQFAVYRWNAIAAGLSEKVVEFYLDSLRPKNIRDPEVAEELSQTVDRVLSALEMHLGETKEGDWLVGSSLTQADLDMGTALAYLTFRYTSEWRNRFPGVFDYFWKLDRRPSFVSTRPELK